MLKQRIALREISFADREGPTTGFRPVETTEDIEFACAGCGRTLLSIRRAWLHNLIAHCTDCNTSNGLQA